MAAQLQFKSGNASDFSHSGQNKYRPIRRKKKSKDEENVIELNYFSRPDRRMGFERGQDPALMAFEHIDKLPLHKIVMEVTKETIKDIKKIDFEEKVLHLADGALQIIHSILDDDPEGTAQEMNQKIIEDMYKDKVRTKFSVLKQRR